MRLYWYGLLMIIKKFLLRQSTGKVICDFSEKMGIVYIKVAQILAMQNVGEIFTEEDRQKLSQICDHCNPIPFSKIQSILRQEYGDDYLAKFQSIDEKPIGSASISQVHRAVLLSGQEVVLKIRRRDITRQIKHDIKQIRRLIHRFGKLANFRNLLGSDRALECYLDWIYQETDFHNEQQNILCYQNFARSVNGKVKNIHTKIVTPKLYPDLCTANIIVMEYIKSPTINQLVLNQANKQRIAKAENEYLTLSFYALLHGQNVVFHGDPHGGNIYLDEDNNIGFLDMGLIFELSPEESSMTRDFFLSAYAGRTEYIVDLLLSTSQLSDVDRNQLIHDMDKEIKTIRDVPVTQFFVENIGIFTQHNIAVPDFLFKMAKAFLALYGMNTITNNLVDTKSLLAQQVADYYIRRTTKDVKNILTTGIKMAPDFLTTTLHQGIVTGLTGQVGALAEFSRCCQVAATNCGEMLDLFKTMVK